MHRKNSLPKNLHFCVVYLHHFAYCPVCEDLCCRYDKLTDSSASLSLCPCSGRGSRRAGERGRWWARSSLAEPLARLPPPPPNDVISPCPFFFPLNAFYLNFKASPALFFLHFFIPSLLCMVMPLEQNRPWNPKKWSWKRKLPAFFSALSLFFFPPPPRQIFAFHISLANSREAPSSSVSAPQVFSARWEEKAYLACSQIASESLPPRFFAIATSETYLHIHPPLCDIANTARHVRFVFVFCRVCVFF